MAMRFFEQQDEARRHTLRLVVLFATAVAGTVVGVHLALTALWWPLHHLLHVPYPRLFAPVNIGVTLVLVIGGWWIETSNLQMPGGVQRLAHRLGAREVRPDSEEAEKRLANIVDEVCIAANMPHPEVMVLPRTRAINAFAAGWERHDAVVAVTQGALELLTREELEGLVAHECSHIHEGDTRLNMELAGMVSGLELVWRFGQAIREREGFGPILGTPIQWAGSIGWLAARWLQASVSREREFLADARAVQWTRSRDGLGGVLRKALAQREDDDDDRSDDPAWPLIAHHLLLVGHEEKKARWFDAHPPLALRIERIYGHPMPALPLSDGAARTIPAAL
jgi:Zn-dependent protease with chaperone function